jgi:hypothetical protein
MQAEVDEIIAENFGIKSKEIPLYVNHKMKALTPKNPLRF